MKQWLFCLFALFAFFALCSHAAEITVSESPEQLELALDRSEPQDKVALLAKLIWVYRNNQSEQAIQYGQRALDLLKQFPDPRLNAQILHSMAWAQMRAGHYDKAVALAEQAQVIAAANQDKSGQAYALNVLGSVEWFKGNFLNSLDYFLKTLDIRKSIGNKLDIARSYNNIGSVYQEISEFDKAREYHELSRGLMEELDYQYGVATSYFNLGIIYQRLGDTKNEEFYLEKANIAFTELGDQAALTEVQINLGYLKLSQKKLDVAQAFFKLSQLAAGKLNNRTLLARATLGQGHIAYLKGDLSMGEKLASQALAIALQLEEQPQIRDAFGLLSDIYRAQGNFEKSLDAFVGFDEAKGAVLSNVYEGKLSLLQQQFDAQQQKARIEFLEKEKSLGELRTLQAEREAMFLTYGLLIVALLVAIICFQYYRLFKKSRMTYMLSITDNLCKCFNRNFLFSDLIPRMVNEKHSVFAMLIDLDKFKEVNDQYGHDIGDKLLAAFSQRVQNIIGHDNYLVRVGGEEFVVLGQNKSPQVVTDLASQIKDQISQKSFQLTDEISLEITCSIGVNMAEVNSERELVELIKEGDLAMYQAKREGRNKVVTLFR